MRTFHSDSRMWSNFVPAELVKLCGVPQGRWPVYVLKELMDNAIAALEELNVRSPMVWVDVRPGTISVADNGPGISDGVLDKILDFDSFGGSNRHHKLPTRGAQGNAFMTIVGAVAAWSNQPHIRITRPCGPTLELRVKLDSVRQEVIIDRIEVGPPGRSRIDVVAPALPWKRGGTTQPELEAMARMMAWINPHVTFMLSQQGGNKSFASLPGCGPALNEANVQCGSVEWFTTEEFAQRLAADVRARPETTLGEWLHEFRGIKRAVHPWGNATPIGQLTAGMEEATFLAKSDQLRQFCLRCLGRAPEPNFEAIGADRLEDFMVEEMGADEDALTQYHTTKGTFTSGDAAVPFMVEVALLQMPDGTKYAPEPVLCMNRTTLYGSPTLKGVKWREKVRGDWHPLTGDLGALCRAYQIDGGKTPAAVVVHVVCPSPGYAGYGKQQFDTSWLTEPLGECFERVTLQVRKQRAGESRRSKTATSDSTIREIVFKLAPEVWEADTEGGAMPIMIRQLYYGVRKLWALHHHKKLEYQTFCVYISEWEQSVGRNMCLRDPRGTVIEPHSGRSIRLGTDEVAKYNPKKWEGHTIIFVEKEGFAHQLKQYAVLKRFDAIVIGSKGFAVESCREVLQKYRKLLGDQVKIVALHDADPAGYMIGYDLATNLPRFGENVEVKVIDVGLTVKEATEMELQDEPFDLKKSVWSMVKNMRKMTVKEPGGLTRPLMDNAAWDAFMPSMMRGTEYPSWMDNPQGRRIELNAMSPRVFIDWLEGHLEANECRKVRPPDDIVNETMMTARQGKVANEVGAMLMRLIGDDAVKEILGQVGVPAFDLDRVLEAKPEQNWEYLSQRAGQTGMDLEPILMKVLGERLGAANGSK